MLRSLTRQSKQRFSSSQRSILAPFSLDPAPTIPSTFQRVQSSVPTSLSARTSTKPPLFTISRHALATAPKKPSQPLQSPPTASSQPNAIDPELLQKIRADPALQRFNAVELAKKIGNRSETTFVEIAKWDKSAIRHFFLLIGVGFFGVSFYSFFVSFNRLKQVRGTGPQLATCTPSAQDLLKETALGQTLALIPPTFEETPTKSQLSDYLDQVEVFLVRDFQILSNEAQLSTKHAKTCLNSLQTHIVILNELRTFQLPPEHTDPQLLAQLEALRRFGEEELEHFFQLRHDLEQSLQSLPIYQSTLSTTTQDNIKLLTHASSQLIQSQSQDDEQFQPTPLQTALINYYIEPLCTVHNELRSWSATNLFCIMHTELILDNYAFALRHLADILNNIIDSTPAPDNSTPNSSSPPSIPTELCIERFQQLLADLSKIHLPDRLSKTPSTPLPGGIPDSFPLYQLNDSFLSFSQKFPPFLHKHTFFHFAPFATVPVTLLNYLTYSALPAVQSQLQRCVNIPADQFDPSISNHLSTQIVSTSNPIIANLFSNFMYKAMSSAFKGVGYIGTQLPIENIPGGKYVRNYFQSLYDWWDIRATPRFAQYADPVLVNYDYPDSPDGFVKVIAGTTVFPSSHTPHHTLHFPSQTFFSPRAGSQPHWTDGAESSINLALSVAATTSSDLNKVEPAVV